MSVMAFLREQHFIANDWSFDSIVLIHYRWKEYPVHTIIKDGKVFAMLHERKKYWSL
jgi:hypothetical protein